MKEKHVTIHGFRGLEGVEIDGLTAVKLQIRFKRERTDTEILFDPVVMEQFFYYCAKYRDLKLSMRRNAGGGDE